MARVQRLVEILDGLITFTPDIESAAVISPDGLPIMGALPDFLERDRLAAMSAALLVLGERAVGELDKGLLDYVIVQGDRGHVMLVPAGPEAVLVGTTYPTARLGLVLHDLRRAATYVKTEMAADLLTVEGGRPPVVDITDQPARRAGSVYR